MSKFHHTVSRRTFMKGLGLAGAGLGAAAATAPVFHDLDELMSSPAATRKHPWWIKERPALSPAVTEVDWSILKPFKSVGGVKQMPPAVRRIEMYKPVQTSLKEAQKAAFATRDDALTGGASTLRRRLPSTDFAGYAQSEPAVKYSGTKEENARVVRAALHYYGMPEVGFLELDDNMKKMLPTSGIRFEDVPQAYVDDKVNVYPNKAKWLIITMSRKEVQMGRMGGKDPFAYWTTEEHGHQAQSFIKRLGYQALTVSGYDNVGYSVLAGMTELGRIQHSVSPYYGTGIKKHNIFITDLPLPASVPIDAGIARFCEVCLSCGQICALNGEDANGVGDNNAIYMEKEPTWDLPNPDNIPDGNGWNRPGTKKWPLNFPACRCAFLCWWSCPFNNVDKAMTHDVIRAAVATTSIFNRFFAEADRFIDRGLVPHFGAASAKSYDKWVERKEQWWNRDLNTWPYDTLHRGDGLP